LLIHFCGKRRVSCGDILKAVSCVFDWIPEVPAISPADCMGTPKFLHGVNQHHNKHFSQPYVLGKEWLLQAVSLRFPMAETPNLEKYFNPVGRSQCFGSH
jgi:hypothetical protein